MAPEPPPRPAPSLPLEPAVMRRWGIDHDAAAGLLRISPELRPPGEDRVGPFRAGRTVVVLSLRHRPAAITLRLAVTFGPALMVEASLADPAWDVPASVDDVSLGSGRVRFEASAEHEVVWRR